MWVSLVARIGRGRLRAALNVALLFACGTWSESAEAAVAIPPRIAIERAVAEKVGNGATVTLSTLETTVGPMLGLVAIPDPSARAGQPVRFQLFAAGTRVGSAVATVRVEARHARAIRAIARDEVVALDAVAFVVGEIPNVPFRHLPTQEELAGLKARRDIAPGEPLIDTALVMVPLVKAGDTVTVVVKIGLVEAQGSGVASGSGHVGDTIHILQRTTRTTLKARITGPAVAEVVQ